MYWTPDGRPARLESAGEQPLTEHDDHQGNETVFIAYVIITAVTIAANAAVAVADLARARFVLATMDEVGVPRS